MTVQELIDRLEQIEDKTKEVKEGECGYPIDDVFEFDTCIYL
ncbi:hypothetical protein [Romboutsia ilealis]|nr:hypothetical protein [Romboutsia ilealis]